MKFWGILILKNGDGGGGLKLKSSNPIKET